MQSRARYGQSIDRLTHRPCPSSATTLAVNPQ